MLLARKMSNLLAHAQNLVYILESLMASAYRRENFTAMLGLFLEEKGYSLPQHSPTKSLSLSVPPLLSAVNSFLLYLTRQRNAIYCKNCLKTNNPHQSPLIMPQL